MKTDADLQDRLQRATAPRLGDNYALDAETAEWREAWLALGALLPPATGSVSEAKCLARIGAGEQERLRTVNRDARLTARRRTWLAAAVVLLAALGVAATMRLPGMQSEIAKPRFVPVASSDPHWNDPLDDDFAAAQHSLAQLQTGWHPSTTAAEALGQQIDEALWAVESETL
jgi:hypothetical protein